MALATDSCLERLVFFWWWHLPLIGGGPWVHPRGHPDTPTPFQTPFLPSGTSSTTLDTVRWRGGLMGLHFSDFFLQSMTLHPNLYPSTMFGSNGFVIWYYWRCR